MTKVCRKVSVVTAISATAGWKEWAPEGGKACARAHHDDWSTQVLRKPEVWILGYIHWHMITHLKCHQHHQN